MNLLNSNEWLSKPRLVCGIMSGTSLDGIDVVLAIFSSNKSGKHEFEILNSYHSLFDRKTLKLIDNVQNKKVTIKEVAELNFLLSLEYRRAIENLCIMVKFDIKKIEVVGIHGQTVFHLPKKEDMEFGNSLQLGSISALAKMIGVPVVGDFRSADIALGGQGAPLVPIFDYEFFRSKERDTILLNIGGIANITYLKAGCKSNEVLAFDTGPGNALIDAVMKRLYAMNFDKNGETASKGKIDKRLFQILKETSFITEKPPKSTGKEYFNFHLIESKMIESGLMEIKGEDLVRTLTEFTTWSIAVNIELFANLDSIVIASGGGVRNKTLMALLQKYLNKSKIRTTSDYGISIDMKEALSFGYLAYRTLGGLPGNLPSVTGASKEAILGVVAI